MSITSKHKALEEYKDALLEDLAEDIITVIELEALEIRNTRL